MDLGCCAWVLVLWANGNGGKNYIFYIRIVFEKCEYRVLLTEMGRFEMLKVWLCAIFLSFTIKCT